MPDSLWLLLTGLTVSLVVRRIVDGNAYGTVADMLLGISGALAMKWLIETMGDWNGIASTYRLLFIIWGAAALPTLAHLYAKRHSIPKRGHSPR
jgi:uncharacterized membrane protein YeaQ/YmgE (transglycosylase-associated protein family)